ncbi:ribosomal protein S5 domain 2-like protein [Sistotremastrum niveocremeum HHB9708]|uniref:Ribosomal protein S5 domain 2-like protein n=1 Tax=Sistotremastrum niveocremeum HHB9708 TaxID=1314777 RepID=A0A165ALN6_9AGAM|nr:ribosomal protein S5 domain 2-like protein [Sistotremastrum niveocremeum HHB9708]
MAQITSFDRRRVNGPDDSFPPIFSDEDQPGSSSSSPLQRESRKPKDIRPIFLQTGLITQANGSAYIETGNSKVVCAVYGPRQAKNTSYSEKGKLNVEVKFAPFASQRRKVPNRDAEDRSLAVLIHQAIVPSVRLELFPKSSMDVFLTVIENDGIQSCGTAGTIAASAALADAGIEMLGLVVSCAGSVMSNGEIWLDPTTRELEHSRASLTLSCMPALGLITNVSQTGQVTPQEAIQCMDACEERCSDIHMVVASALHKNQSAL